MHRSKCMTGLSISLLGNCEITYEHRQSDVFGFCRGREEQKERSERLKSFMCMFCVFLRLCMLEFTCSHCSSGLLLFCDK